MPGDAFGHEEADDYYVDEHGFNHIRKRKTTAVALSLVRVFVMSFEDYRVLYKSA